MNVLLIGASEKPHRYSFLAINMLRDYDHKVTAIANRAGKVGDVVFQKDMDLIDDSFHTVTLYINAKLQEGYYDAILRLKPKRVIFNPGTQNPAFAQKLSEQGIVALEACTLVMLRSGQF